MPRRSPSGVTSTGISVREVLQRALDAVGPQGHFTVRRIYRERGVVTTPLGVGAVLRFAARDGLVRVVGEKGRGLRVYQLTKTGLDFVSTAAPDERQRS